MLVVSMTGLLPPPGEVMDVCQRPPGWRPSPHPSEIGGTAPSALSSSNKVSFVETACRACKDSQGLPTGRVTVLVLGGTTGFWGWGSSLVKDPPGPPPEAEAPATLSAGRPGPDGRPSTQHTLSLSGGGGGVASAPENDRPEWDRMGLSTVARTGF